MAKELPEPEQTRVWDEATEDSGDFLEAEYNRVFANANFLVKQDEDVISQLLADLGIPSPAVTLFGLSVVQGVSDSLNIPLSVAYVERETEAGVNARPVVPELIDFPIPNAVLDNATVNFVKVRALDETPHFEVVVDDVVPIADKEAQLDTFVGPAGGPYVFSGESSTLIPSLFDLPGQLETLDSKHPFADYQRLTVSGNYVVDDGIFKLWLKIKGAGASGATPLPGFGLQPGVNGGATDWDSGSVVANGGASTVNAGTGIAPGGSGGIGGDSSLNGEPGSAGSGMSPSNQVATRECQGGRGGGRGGGPGGIIGSPGQNGGLGSGGGGNGLTSAINLNIFGGHGGGEGEEQWFLMDVIPGQIIPFIIGGGGISASAGNGGSGYIDVWS